MDAEEFFFDTQCPKITERIQKLLFPEHIPQHLEKRKLVTNGKIY